MRRGPGIVALDRHARSASQYTSLVQELNASKVETLRQQIDAFAQTLREFAANHKQDIRQDPEFRHAFQSMCSSLFVDPLTGHPPTARAGSRLGKVGEIWNDLLGFSDWQFSLGVQIVDVCVSTRSQNGGLIAMDDLIGGVMRLRNGTGFTEQTERITAEDIARSIKALRPLGCGYELFEIRGRAMVRTVPHELSPDTQKVLSFMFFPGLPCTDAVGVPFISTTNTQNEETRKALSGDGAIWTELWANQVLDDMLLNDGILWLDIVPSSLDRSPEHNRRRYYSVSLGESLLSRQGAVAFDRVLLHGADEPSIPMDARP
ncbi:ESCRT II complex subunit Dot2 [Malassezia vespertilionis]|uniref:Uncharacterized protein n=1 Tax=Malassezia vespertilionis TaxID=2020962 RepID=A0A2N1JBG8_9BASI|nr:ESCRT II complex subunit Dot2 [Malassezia vespertilionis]PKI83888.1 hypothetical protein MVES_001898 [Malassezia vespertilionis]WFD06651.1 ESCRT II complex subunit Dot2 [Malassezia vespertilionis]